MEIAPMLATAAEPFDSPEHLFEIKWDGICALAAVEGGGWRLWGRSANSYTDRYPELAVLQQLPVGTVLDGELVRWMPQGHCDFPAVLRRHQLVSPPKIRWASLREPVTHVVFDLLRLAGRCLLKEPLRLRRELLEELLSSIPGQPLRLPEAATTSGTSFFRRTADEGHEGVMAKRLDSRYQPGQRSPAWRKIKPREETVCVILGYRARRDGLPRCLLLGAQHGQELRYVGEVGCRLGDTARWAALLAERPSAGLLLPCGKQARWVWPELYCRVRHFGWTVWGRLRFRKLVGLLPIGSQPAS